MSKQRVDTDYQYQKIITERTLWLMKPLAIVCMVMWCMHPATSMPQVLERNVLAGFLVGAFYGIFINRRILRYYLFTRRVQTLEKRNRVPEEYYFGRIREVLDEEKK